MAKFWGKNHHILEVEPNLIQPLTAPYDDRKFTENVNKLSET